MKKYIILFTIALFSVQVLFSQSPYNCDFTHDVITISSDCSASLNNQLSVANLGYTVTARDQIEFKPGSEIKAVSGKLFDAHTDHTVVPIAPDYISTANIVTGSSRTLDQANSVPGSIGGTVNINPSGAATSSIPIMVSPGSHGMQPNLSVEYNSQSGNDILGYCWHLSGLSTIRLVSQNQYYDNNIYPITFGSGDALILDGQRLISTGTNTYAPENNPYISVSYDGTKFTVTTQDGMVMEYGGTTDSHFYPSNGPSTLTWAINKTTDANGNYILYKYIGDNTAGEYHISEIDYTGNGSITPYNSIYFYYGKRTDGNTSYIGGYAIGQTTLLASIKVFAEGAIAYDYGFSYFSDGLYSKLNQISLTANGNNYNPTIINWGAVSDYSTTVSDASTNFGNLNNNTLYFGDFNGDGKTDVVQWNGNSALKVLISQGGGNYSAPININLSNSAIDIKVVDWNNDGKDEIMAHCSYLYSDTVFCYQLSGTSFQKLTELNNTGSTYQYFYADVDNNGIMDRIVVNNGAFTGIDNLSLSAIPTITNIDKIIPMDFDGDGQLEFLILNSSGYGWIWKYTSHEFKSIYGNGSTYLFGNAKNIFTGDFNGDGKTDYIAYVGGAWNVNFSTGRGFTSGSAPNGLKNYNPASIGQLDTGNPNFVWNTQTLGECSKWSKTVPGNVDQPVCLQCIEDVQNQYPAQSMYKPVSTIAISDMNNDGKDDIIFAGNDSVYVFISKGTGFILENSAQASTVKSANLVNIQLYVEDLNGDGQNEIIYGNDDYNYSTTRKLVSGAGITCSYHTVTGTLGSMVHDTYKEITFNNRLDNSLYVNSVTDGNNIEWVVNYAPTFTNVSGTRNYPIVPITKPLKLASDLAKINLTGASVPIISHYYYTYTNGYIHLQGKGFLGFQTVSSNDAISLVSKTLNFTNTIYDNLGNSCTYTGLSSQYVSKNSVPFYSISNSYTAEGGNMANKLFLPLSTKTVIADSLKSYTTTNSVVYFDATLGRITDQKSVASDGGTTPNNNWTTETINTFATVSGNQSVLTKQATTRTLGKDSYTSTIGYVYSNGTYPFRVTSQTAQNKITTTYNSFDNFGNVTSAKVSVSDGTHPRSTSCIYDNYGRFVISATDVTQLTSTYTYRASDGALLSKTDPNGLRVSHNYSRGSANLVSTETLPDGNVCTTSVSWDNSVTSGLYMVTKAITNGNTTNSYFNAIGQKLKEITYGFNAKPLTTLWTYNSDGTVNTVTDNAGNITAYSYNTPDGSKRLYTIKGLNTDLKYTYNKAPYTVTINDNIMGQVKALTIDALGKVTSVNDNSKNIIYAYAASGKITTITNADGNKTSLSYDPDLLTQTSLSDPDAGNYSYSYNNFGQLTSQTDASNQTINLGYDNYGRIISKKSTDKSGKDSSNINYNYSPTQGSLGLLASVSRDNVSETYTYDALERISSVTTSGPATPGGTATNYVLSYAYNNIGQLSSVNYPSGITLNYTYDNIGNLSAINNTTFGTIWAGNSVNDLNLWTQYTLGNGLTTYKDYDGNFRLKSVQTGTTSNKTSVQNLGFNFNQAGQLIQRTDGTFSLSEGFNYDPLDRLLHDSIVGQPSIYHTTSYLDNGNINSTSWGGNYTYNACSPGGPHAVCGVSGVTNTGQTPSPGLITTSTYNPNNQVLTIDNGTYHTDYTYGPSGNRFRVDYKTSGSPTYSKVYIGNSEFGYYQSGTGNYKRTIIYAPTGVCAVYQDSGNVQNIYYIHTDYLGSWLAITDNTGTVKNRYSYDAWGRPRNYKTWQLLTISAASVPAALVNLNAMQPRFDRGYTGHEQLAGFGLINANARLYDPYLQRFLSPDPEVQNPASYQNYNRYSYCLNNPLRYNDPTGREVPTDAPSDGDSEQPGGDSDASNSDESNLSPLTPIIAPVTSTYVSTPTIVNQITYWEPTITNLSIPQEVNYNNLSATVWGYGSYNPCNTPSTSQPTSPLSNTNNINQLATTSNNNNTNTDQSNLNDRGTTNNINFNSFDPSITYYTPVGEYTTPGGTRLEFYHTYKHYEGSTPIELAINITNNNIQYTVHKGQFPFPNTTYGKDFVTQGSDYVSYGADKSDNLVVDLQIPWFKSNVGVTLTFSKENNINFLNIVENSITKSPWVIPWWVRVLVIE